MPSAMTSGTAEGALPQVEGLPRLRLPPLQLRPLQAAVQALAGGVQFAGPQASVPPSGGTAQCRECGMPIRFKDDPLCCLCGGDAWVQCYPTRVGKGWSGMPAYIVPSKRAG